MCRIFGFRSILKSSVHSSLINADNALSIQSVDHPNGWGVAHYVGGSPHLIKSDRSAMNCDIFKQVSGVVSSNTVLAHIRKSTIGDVSVLNTHPFQYGKWVFAHNGNINNFELKKDELFSMVSQNLAPFVLGSTDSELIFLIILSELEKMVPMDSPSTPYALLESACCNSINKIISCIGSLSNDTDPPESNFLTFTMTDGSNMIAFHGGKNLHYSTYKSKCPDRDSCDFFGQSCEAPPETSKINHLLISSEPLSGENIWQELKKGTLIGVDENMCLNIKRLETE